MSVFSQTFDQIMENETIQSEIIENKMFQDTTSYKMSFSEQINKLSKLSKIEKTKFIFFCFSLI